MRGVGSILDMLGAGARNIEPQQLELGLGQTLTPNAYDSAGVGLLEGLRAKGARGMYALRDSPIATAKRGARFAGSALMSTPGTMALGVGATLGAQSILEAMAKSKAQQQQEATAQLNPGNQLMGSPYQDEMMYL